jgi:Holliday junction resolvase RusA-like endonuclease
MRLNVEPMGAPRWQKSDLWNPRPVMVRYHQFKDDCRRALPGYTLPDILEIDFYIPMPKSWNKKKREAMHDQLHQQTPDWDNCAKAFMDVWKYDDVGNKVNDAHVAGGRVMKYWTDGPGYIVLP